MRRPGTSPSPTTRSTACSRGALKLLHTSDWHVGKTIRGRSRADEHRCVFDEMLAAVDEHDIDVVLVAGDLFETSAPTPEAESVVNHTLLGFAERGAQVAVISGNHDNARRLAAVAPVFEAMGRVHVVTEPARPDDGGVRTFETSSGETLRLAMLPFVSQRGIVRARDLMDSAAFEQAQAYAERLRLLVEALCGAFTDDTVNVLMAHAFVLGGATGGGERSAHLVEEYGVPAQVMPATAGYVALGHLHRAQRISGPGSIHYCGSPLQLDFGEEEQAKQINVVELEPGVPARITPVPLTGGRRLRTVTGSLAELEALAGDAGSGIGEDWLRVRVLEAARAGLAETVRELLGDRVVDVRLDTDAAGSTTSDRPRRSGRSPVELFDEFLAEHVVADERVGALFAELLDDAQQGDLT